MSDKSNTDQPQGLKLADIYFILFRQKWLILFFSAVAIVATSVLLILNPALYQSHAKLFIRYIVNGRALSPPGNEQSTRPVDDEQQGIINTELEILKSFDLAEQVAKEVGPEKLLGNLDAGTNVEQAAAGLVMRNLIIDPTLAKGSVIPIIFQHADPAIARETLGAIIHVYYKKHSEAHQPMGMFGDFLGQETKRLQDQLTETEQQLRSAKIKAGIFSPGVTSQIDAAKACSDQISRIRMDLFNAEAELASHQALIDQPGDNLPAATVATNTMQPPVPPDILREYRNTCARLDGFTRRAQELLFSFTDTNAYVVEVQEQVSELQKAKDKLEQLYPALASMGMPQSFAGPLAASFYPYNTELMQAKALKSKIKLLNTQLNQRQAEAIKLDEMQMTISDLERKKEIQEADLKYFSANLEHATIDEELGTSKAPNISIIDPPTPAVKARSKAFKKQLAMVAAAPICAGLALAFLIELFLDTSVKRPSDVSAKLHLPLFMSIPKIRTNGRVRFPALEDKNRLRLNEANGKAGTGASPGNGRMEVGPWEANHPLRRFYEGLRDRLIIYFEVSKLVHKPKLVAVTSCGPGAGVTSMAAGLAATLSETGDGKVLYVDMNPEQQGASQMFYKGKPGCGLEDALQLETKENAMVQENLYAAAAQTQAGALERILPKQFTQMVPRFRASDYDYIIFDMPPITQTSVTPRLACLMDMVLLVIESEKTRQEVVQHASSLLAHSSASVGVVLNKTKTYVPSRLHQELLEGS